MNEYVGSPLLCPLLFDSQYYWSVFALEFRSLNLLCSLTFLETSGRKIERSSSANTDNNCVMAKALFIVPILFRESAMTVSTVEKGLMLGYKLPDPSGLLLNQEHLNSSQQGSAPILTAFRDPARLFRHLQLRTEISVVGLS